MFHPTANDWPAPHRTLAFLCLSILALLLLGYALYLHPKKAALEQQKKVLAEKKAKFHTLSLPLDPIRLKEHLLAANFLLEGAPQEGLPGLRRASDSALSFATSSFSRKIRENYQDTLAFIYGATRLDYKDLHNRVAAEFLPDASPLEKTYFGLEAEDGQEQPVWQMIAKLWTIQDILQKSRAAGLRLATQEDGTVKIAADSVIAYTLSDKKDGPCFLLEFPINATFSGTLDQFLAFAASLQNPDSCLPLKRLSIRTFPPDALLAGNANAVDLCLFTIQCSAFMMPQASDSPPPPEEPDESTPEK